MAISATSPATSLRLMGAPYRWRSYAPAMRTKAAVLWESGAPLSVEEVELGEPQAGEVRVRIAAAGVCRSDLHVMDGTWAYDLPMVLGHEGAGYRRRRRRRACSRRRWAMRSRSRG